MARDSAASRGGAERGLDLLQLRTRPEREWDRMLSTLTNGDLAAILRAHGGGTKPGTKGTLHLSKQSLLSMLSVSPGLPPTTLLQCFVTCMQCHSTLARHR